MRASTSSPVLARLGVSLALLALAGWLLWSVSARQALLLLVGVGLGAVLAAARFGFTTGWRDCPCPCWDTSRRPPRRWARLR